MNGHHDCAVLSDLSIDTLRCRRKRKSAGEAFGECDGSQSCHTVDIQGSQPEDFLHCIPAENDVTFYISHIHSPGKMWYLIIPPNLNSLAFDIKLVYFFMEVYRNEQSMYYLWQGSNGRQHGQPFHSAQFSSFPAESSHSTGRDERQSSEDSGVRQVSQEAEGHRLIRRFDE